MIEKLVAFVRWLTSPEELPPQKEGGDALQEVDSRPEHAPKSLGALRRIFATETLRSAEPDSPVKPAHPPRFWRWVMSEEELPVAEAVDHDRASRTNFLARLLKAEECPKHAGEAVERRAGSFRRLLAAEPCPSQPAPAQQRRGIFPWLARPEECPVESPSATVRHQGFWYKLFASEKL